MMVSMDGMRMSDDEALWTGYDHNRTAFSTDSSLSYWMERWRKAL